MRYAAAQKTGPWRQSKKRPGAEWHRPPDDRIGFSDGMHWDLALARFWAAERISCCEADQTSAYRPWPIRIRIELIGEWPRSCSPDLEA